MTIVSDKKRFAISSDCMTKRHRFSCSRGFIKQRGIGDLEPCQVGDHGLKIEEGFKPALREFSLIGCVSSVPTRVFQNISLNDWRRDAIGIATADE